MALKDSRRYGVSRISVAYPFRSIVRVLMVKARDGQSEASRICLVGVRAASDDRKRRPVLFPLLRCRCAEIANNALALISELKGDAARSDARVI